MRFFTPALYEQLNSTDPSEVDRAMGKWEAAVAQYRGTLASTRRNMPIGARALSKLVLHDWDVLPIRPAAGSAQQVIGLRHDGNTVILLYQLSGRQRTTQPTAGWPLSATRKHWLYDELDVSDEKPGAYVHRVLFSDGSVTEIPFLDCTILRSRPATRVPVRTNRI